MLLQQDLFKAMGHGNINKMSAAVKEYVDSLLNSDSRNLLVFLGGLFPGFEKSGANIPQKFAALVYSLMGLLSQHS